MSSTFGTLLKVSTFGESHCKGVGAVLDGCPPGMRLSEADIQPQLDRRRPGQSKLDHRPPGGGPGHHFLGGGKRPYPGHAHRSFRAQQGSAARRLPGNEQDSTPVPCRFHLPDEIWHPGFVGWRAFQRPGNHRAGRSRPRWPRKCSRKNSGWRSSPGSVPSAISPPKMWTRTLVTRKLVDGNPIRCPSAAAAEKMQSLVARVKEEKDSVGGIVSCVCRHVPVGWGEPVFDKLEAKLAQAMLSHPGHQGASRSARDLAAAGCVDRFTTIPLLRPKGGWERKPTTVAASRAAFPMARPSFFGSRFKPPATIGLAQQTVDFDGQPVTLEAKGRHDPCVVPRAVPIVEAMAALVLGDFALRQHTRLSVNGIFRPRPAFSLGLNPQRSAATPCDFRPRCENTFM